jgi:PleD family two-component response regulator
MENQRVLIIDDDRDIANLFHMVLSVVGFDCTVVYSGRDALSRLAQSVPDLVLLDMRLGPEISGEDILFQIRSNPRLVDTRVIVITGYPSMADRISDLTDLILVKPVDIDQLKTLTQRVASQGEKTGQIYFRDPVTGLYNQEFFKTRLEHAFARLQRRPDFLYATVVFEIEFEALQEQNQAITFDHLMHELGYRLAMNFRPTDTVARFSMHKFATLHEDLKDTEDLEVIIERLKRELLKPYEVEGGYYQAILRLGAAVSSREFNFPDDIMKLAEEELAKSGQGK